MRRMHLSPGGPQQDPTSPGWERRRVLQLCVHCVCVCLCVLTYVRHASDLSLIEQVDEEKLAQNFNELLWSIVNGRRRSRNKRALEIRFGSSLFVSIRQPVLSTRSSLSGKFYCVNIEFGSSNRRPNLVCPIGAGKLDIDRADRRATLKLRRRSPMATC